MTNAAQDTNQMILCHGLLVQVPSPTLVGEAYRD